MLLKNLIHINDYFLQKQLLFEELCKEADAKEEVKIQQQMLVDNEAVDDWV